MTDDDVRAIRSAVANRITYAVLSEQYDVDSGVIGAVARRVTYQYVKELD